MTETNNYDQDDDGSEVNGINCEDSQDSPNILESPASNLSETIESLFDSIFIRSTSFMDLDKSDFILNRQIHICHDRVL
jgi:hypothetical protein